MDAERNGELEGSPIVRDVAPPRRPLSKRPVRPIFREKPKQFDRASSLLRQPKTVAKPRKLALPEFRIRRRQCNGGDSAFQRFVDAILVRGGQYLRRRV